MGQRKLILREKMGTGEFWDGKDILYLRLPCLILDFYSST